MRGKKLGGPVAAGIIFWGSISTVLAHGPVAQTSPPGVKPSAAVSAPTLGAHGLPERTTTQTSYVGVEQSVGVDTGIPPASVDGKDVSVMSHCATWWLNGSHSWDVNWYGKTEFEAQSNTYYGSATDPNSCGRPALIVDWIMLDGYLVQALWRYEFAHMRAEALNVSSVKKHTSSWLAACGGKVRHEARKSGITWGLTSRSNCME